MAMIINFDNSEPMVSSHRVIYTPSSFAKSSLLHLQETGTLKALHPHRSERDGMNSYLFFTVLSGSGGLFYEGKYHKLSAGDCVFIDCKKAYSHETGMSDYGDKGGELWSLSWCHFYGPNMNAVYRKYQERGGRPVFQTNRGEDYCHILSELYQTAESADYVRDMRINEKLSSLLILLMEDAWSEEYVTEGSSNTADIRQVKEFLDQNFMLKISLDELSSRFFISKYYLMSLFKEYYGMTVTSYINLARVTYVKQNLRFTDKTVEAIALELNIESTYLSRLFKKLEGITPSEYRKQWRGSTTEE